MYKITIGKGLDQLKFGSTKKEVQKQFGEPTEQDLYNLSDEEDGFLTETWHYDNEEFSVSFDEEDNWRLTTITCSHSDCEINGKKIMGLSIDQIKQVINLEELGEVEIEDLSDEGINQKCYSFLESSLNLWFLDDKLTEIQWGVLWEDEDTPLWP